MGGRGGGEGEGKEEKEGGGEGKMAGQEWEMGYSTNGKGEAGDSQPLRMPAIPLAHRLNRLIRP
jgi:hypothetical protein